MNDNDRQEARLARAQTIFIEVQSHYPADNGNDKLLICSSVDLSANGIRALVDEPLPVEAIYHLCVELHETAERLFLVAQVKWVKNADDQEGYYIGLSIFESDDTDIERWKQHIADQLNA